jgi:hypothetical protein
MEFKTSIYFSRSRPFIDSGGGGRRRTFQVYEALKTLGPIKFLTAARSEVDKQTLMKIDTLFQKPFSKYFVTEGEYKLWSKDRRDEVFYLRSISRQWIKKVEGLSGLDLAIVEDPIYFKPLVKKLHRLGIPIIASCQNIETLSYPQIPFEKQKDLFSKELDTLALCDLVISISREDTWLLRNFKIPAFFFPYFPPEQIKKRLLTIRQHRQKNKKENIMLLGNAGNMATRKGMEKVLQYWRTSGLSRSFGRLWAVGYKTDIFFKEMNSDNDMEFLGSLPEVQLDEKLGTVKACLCYQEGGGGALTRISEMLVAGVPILASSHAARTYHNMKGVIEFRDLENLEEALKQVDPFDGNGEEIPIPSEPDAFQLVAEIKKAIDR